jgi:hypothetical protein
MFQGAHEKFDSKENLKKCNMIVHSDILARSRSGYFSLTRCGAASIIATGKEPMAMNNLTVECKPAVVRIGETVTVRCVLPPDIKEFSSALIVVREFPSIRYRMKKTGAGLEIMVSVPGGSPAGTYHLDLMLRGASREGGAPEVLASGEGVIEVIFDDEEPFSPQAPDFHPELVSQTMQLDGRKILIETPYREHAHWFKGQLHCHTERSDGDRTVESLLEEYRRRNYHFVSVTDHDAWYGGGEDGGLIILPGEERTTDEGHILVLLHRKQLSRRVCQYVIDEAVAEGGMAAIAHPFYRVGFPGRSAEHLRGFHFVEIYNGETAAVSPGSENATSLWDYLLTSDRRVWGIAVDDYHRDADAPLDMGFVMVNAPRLDRDAILENLRWGNFYATTGPTVAFSIGEGMLHVRTDEPSTILWYGPHGLPVKSRGHVTESRYSLQGDEGYIRAEVVRERDGGRAWTQPIFIRALE